MDELVGRFRQAFASAVPGHRESVVVAVSGGADSMALLHLFAGLRPRPPITAAHLDHALRPDSARDAEFVLRQAGAIGVPCRVERIADGELRPAGRGVEAAARDHRYRFLGRVARERGARFVATAHHRDDQAETVLLRILRGAGPAGLAAIRPIRPLDDHGDVRLLRPLLATGRREIVAWLSARAIPWREDPTNHGDGNLRAIVRRRLLPALEADTRGLVERLARLAERAAELPAEAAGGPAAAWPPREALLASRGLLRAVLEARSPAGPALDRRTVDRAAARVRAGRGQADLGGGRRLTVRGGRLEISGD